MDNGKNYPQPANNQGANIKAQFNAAVRVEHMHFGPEEKRNPEQELFEAVAVGDIPTVKKLLLEDVSVHATNKDGATLLHVAASHGQLVVVHLLLKEGADVCAVRLSDGCIPLHVAAQQASPEVVNALLHHGFTARQINALSKEGSTPLHKAVQQNHPEVAQALLDAKANVNALRASDGHTPLRVVAGIGHADVIHILLKGGATVDARFRTYRCIVQGEQRVAAGQAKAMKKKAKIPAISPQELQHDPNPATGQDRTRLGQGSFGVVYAGRYQGEPVAIKTLHVSTAALINQLKKEAVIMVSVDSPYTVALHGICESLQETSLVMEKMEGGSLFNLLHKGEGLPWALRYRLAVEITEGLWALHKQNILHRDLKSLNVLLDGSNHAKITDFGLSRLQNQISSIVGSKQSVGTLTYKAPEIIQYEEENDGSGSDEEAPAAAPAKPSPYSPYSDIYALGVILWELASQKPPFQKLKEIRIKSRIKKGEHETLPPDCPEELGKLILACWQLNPKKRPHTDTLLLQLKALYERESPQQLPELGGRQEGKQHAKRVADKEVEEIKKAQAAQQAVKEKEQADAEKQVAETAYKAEAENAKKTQEAADKKWAEQSQEQEALKAKPSLANAVKGFLAGLFGVVEQAQIAQEFEQVQKQTAAEAVKQNEEMQKKIEQLEQVAKKAAKEKEEMETAREKVEAEKRAAEAARKAEAEQGKKAQEAVGKKLADQWQAKEVLKVQDLVPPAGLPPGESKEEQIVYASPFAEPKKSKKAMASKDPGVLQFLSLVAEGAQWEAEELLRKNPHLALASGAVTDRSNRRFGCISGFQYAVWALDWKMWRMVLKYLPAFEAADQLAALEADGTEHGQHFSLNPLLEALDTYIKNFDAWWQTGAGDKMKTHWCQQVGGCQLLLPVHVAQEYSHRKRSFNPCPDFREEARSESLITNRGDWYASVFNGGKLGQKFAYVRGRDGWPLSFESSAFAPAKIESSAIDLEALQSLSKMRQLQLDELKGEFRKQAANGKEPMGVTVRLKSQPKGEQIVYAPLFIGSKKRKKAIASQDPAVLQFLTLVAEGKQGEAEAMLQKNPHLALTSGSVTDRSNRRFGCITGFQYAAWALDWKMWQMVLKYLPKGEAADQLAALEAEGTEHGQHFSLDPLLGALNTYIKNYDVWYKAKAWDAMRAHWFIQVGGCQLLLPVHIAQEYCDDKRSFDPCPDVREEARSESLITNRGDWYASIFNGGKLGQKFAYVRGCNKQAWGVNEYLSHFELKKKDAEALQRLSKIRQLQLEELKVDLREYATPQQQARCPVQ